MEAEGLLQLITAEGVFTTELESHLHHLMTRTMEDEFHRIN